MSLPVSLSLTIKPTHLQMSHANLNRQGRPVHGARQGHQLSAYPSVYVIEPTPTGPLQGIQLRPPPAQPPAASVIIQLDSIRPPNKPTCDTHTGGRRWRRLHDLLATLVGHMETQMAAGLLLHLLGARKQRRGRRWRHQQGRRPERRPLRLTISPAMRTILSSNGPSKTYLYFARPTMAQPEGRRLAATRTTGGSCSGGGGCRDCLERPCDRKRNKSSNKCDELHCDQCCKLCKWPDNAKHSDLFQCHHDCHAPEQYAAVVSECDHHHHHYLIDDQHKHPNVHHVWFGVSATAAPASPAVGETWRTTTTTS